jgi:hypothetical protein
MGLRAVRQRYGRRLAGGLDDAPESERIGIIHAALTAVGSCDSHVDASRAEVALAAAALVARNLAGGDEFQSRNYGPVNQIPSMPEGLIPLATEVVDCLLNGENDVKEDCCGGDEAEKWFSIIRRLHTVLAGNSPDALDRLAPSVVVFQSCIVAPEPWPSGGRESQHSPQDFPPVRCTRRHRT